MKKSFILASILATAMVLGPSAAFAQTDQTTTAPVATDTPAPGATANPMDTTAPEANAAPAPGGGNGLWGLIGLIGLVGLVGARRNRTTIS